MAEVTQSCNRGPKSHSRLTQEYRHIMFRLNKNLPPNPPLQRPRSAPLRSLLSRKTLDA